MVEIKTELFSLRINEQNFNAQDYQNFFANFGRIKFSSPQLHSRFSGKISSVALQKQQLKIELPKMTLVLFFSIRFCPELCFFLILFTPGSSAKVNVSFQSIPRSGYQLIPNSFRLAGFHR